MAEPGVKGHRSGFVSILGRPNAGKSTLLNALVGSKVAIVSDKPHTTRTPIQGVLTKPEAQIVFLDTPGIHKAGTMLNRRMMDSVHEALEERDLILFVADASARVGREDHRAVELLGKTETPALLVVNKIDLVQDKRLLLPLIEAYGKLHAFEECVPVSAATGEGLEELAGVVTARLPEGPRYFPEDFLTDQPERFLAAELIREQVLAATRQEVPHSVAVVVENWEETPKLTRISAAVMVERPGQKVIVIGARGAMLKKIGTLARHQIEAMLGRKVFLEIFVKVEPGWREKPRMLSAVDWRMEGRQGDRLDIEGHFHGESESS